MGNVLVLGASGFVGRNIYNYLSICSSRKVFGTYHSKYFRDLYKVDLTKEDEIKPLLNSVKPEIVIQCAATTSGSKEIKNKPWYHVTDNVIMNSLLLREAHLSGVKQFIFFSCPVMYNPKTLGTGLVTEHSFDGYVPKQYFGVGNTKVYIEKMCEFYASLGSMKCMAIRHSNTYGPYDKFDLERSHVLGATITKVLQATDTIKVWGTGEEVRDFIYIDDVVNFVEKAINAIAGQKDNFELINVGSGMPVKVIDLIKTIIEVSGKNLKIEHDLTAPQMSSQCPLDSSKARALYGWEYKVRLEEGLKKTINWVKENINLDDYK